MPVLHGSQGCTHSVWCCSCGIFAKRSAADTAMNEVATILGGLDNIEQSILNIVKRANLR